MARGRRTVQRFFCLPPSLSAAPVVAVSATAHTSIAGDPADGTLDDLMLAIVSDCVNVLASLNALQAGSCMSEFDFG